MSRDRCFNLRSSLRIYPFYNHDVAATDPLWHSGIMTGHFRGNSASIAVPTGVLPFDQDTMKFKGRTRALTFLKIKPVRFGFFLYASVGWGAQYWCSVADNGSEDKRGISLHAKYCSLFGSLRLVHTRLSDDKLVLNDSPFSAQAL